MVQFTDSGTYSIQLLHRFNAIESAELTNNNPDIVDLSDETRPTKISEQYLELYDNEWTNAFTVLEDQGLSGRESISKLLEILNVCTMICISNKNSVALVYVFVPQETFIRSL